MKFNFEFIKLIFSKEQKAIIEEANKEDENMKTD
jgi:hypothetical protein